ARRGPDRRRRRRRPCRAARGRADGAPRPGSLPDLCSSPSSEARALPALATYYYPSLLLTSLVECLGQPTVAGIVGKVGGGQLVIRLDRARDADPLGGAGLDRVVPAEPDGGEPG